MVRSRFPKQIHPGYSIHGMKDLSLRLEEFERLENPISLVRFRIRLTEYNGPGLPSAFLSVIQEHSQPWIQMVTTLQGRIEIPLARQESTQWAHRALSICKRLCSMDATLSEELGREGLHVILTKIMRLDPNQFREEDDQDTMIEIQDLAGEMAAMASPFPSLVAPFTNQELIDRLPLIFTIQPVQNVSASAAETMTILINQVKERQSSQADVGYLMWPSAVVLSRYLATNPHELLDKSVLEIGAGCGLTGLVAAQIKAAQEMKKHTTVVTSSVLLTDFNKVVVKNCQQNIVLNGLEGIAKAEELDFYKQDISINGWLDASSGSGPPRDQVDLILAADVICQKDDALATARTLYCALKPGGKALVVSADAQHRFGVEHLEGACHAIGLQVTTEKVRSMYGGRLLTDHMEQTTGYVESMTLTMFTVLKPSVPTTA